MTQPFDHSGKHVFVAGGTSGINLGIAQGYALAGARVTVLSRNPDKVEAAVASLKTLGTEAQGFAGDVREAERMQEVFDQAAAGFGEIDVLISGAAGNFPAPAIQISPNGFKSVIGIDLLGTFHVIKAAIPHIKKPGGVIINISAPQAFVPMNFQMHVCAAKAGIDMITRVGALEWGELGLRVNSIAPGPIEETEGMERLAPSPEAKQATRQSIPLGRYGTKSDIANACMFLSSPYASFISGVVLPVDGGWSLGGIAAVSAGLKAALSA